MSTSSSSVVTDLTVSISGEKVHNTNDNQFTSDVEVGSTVAEVPCSSLAPSTPLLVVAAPSDKMFGKRELDFEADTGDFVVVYPDEQAFTEGYRFWIAKAVEPMSFLLNKRKQTTIVYYNAKGNTDYLEFHIESGKKVKIPFKQLLGKCCAEDFSTQDERHIVLKSSVRDKWCRIAKDLDAEAQAQQKKL